MLKVVKSSAVVVAALWVGCLFTVGFVVAPYLFILAARKSPAVPNTGVAADLVGPLLYNADVAGLVVGAGLIATMAYLRRRGEQALGSRFYLGELGLAVAVACAAVNYWGFTPRIQRAQSLLAQRYGAFHLADKADPLFRQFDGLHQTSTALFFAGFTAALVGLVCLTQFRTRTPNPERI